MPIKFTPIFQITPTIAQNLMKIEGAKNAIVHLPLNPIVLRSLRETARLYTTYYSTKIEGNKLTPLQIEAVLKGQGHFPGLQRDEKEVKGYFSALAKIEQWAAAGTQITEQMIQKLHAIVMSNGNLKAKPTLYRDGKNVIRDGATKAIVYMPPQAEDVAELMKEMVSWLHQNHIIPCPIVAAIIHYQFATIHPYYDGNGRVARLLTTLILHQGGYDLKGLYQLEEYYEQNLSNYYEALNIGPSHNYYMGRAESDITPWIEYFIAGMVVSFENVARRMEKEKGLPDHSQKLKQFDPKQRKVLELFIDSDVITSRQVGKLFGFQPRTASKLCFDLVESGFLEIVDFSNKARKYKLAEKYQHLVTG